MYNTIIDGNHSIKKEGRFNTMTGLIMKLIICPLTLIISDYLFADVYYLYIYQAIFTGITIALVAHLMELFLLKPGTLLISTIADFLVAFVIVYFSHIILPGVKVTLIGGALVSTLLALTEYFQHLYLIRSGKTIKSE